MSHLIEAPPYRTPEWHLWRRHGLGASDLAAVVGIDPYRGEHELALEKRGLRDDIGNVATAWGHRIEQVALDAYSETRGVELARGETWGDGRWPDLWASLDARHGRIGVEIKATVRWTSPPDHVVVQAQGQMGLADLDVIDLVRVSPYGEPIVTTIERDERDIDSLLSWAEEWWQRHGPGGVLPPVDGSDAARRHLATMAGTGTLTGTMEMDRFMASLRQARQDRIAAEGQEALLRNLLAAAMPGYDRAEGDGWRITWASIKGRVNTDWKAVAAAYRGRLARTPRYLDHIEAQHTTTGDPTRSFRPTWNEED